MAVFTYASVSDFLADSAAGGEEAIALSSLDDPTIETVAPDSPAEATIIDALAFGTRQIDGILAKRYAITVLHAFFPPLQVLVDIDIDLARYNLERYGTREHVKRRRDDALERLRRIANGEESLLDNSGEVLKTGGEQQLTRRGRVGKTERRFTMGRLDSLILPGLGNFPTVPSLVSRNVRIEATGTGSGDSLEAFTSYPISALKIVTLLDGKWIYASSDNLAHFDAFLGITTRAAGEGEALSVVEQGFVNSDSWAWDISRGIFLGLAGAITQDAPSTGFLRQLGTVVGLSQIEFDPQEGILL